MTSAASAPDAVTALPERNLDLLRAMAVLLVLADHAVESLGNHALLQSYLVGQPELRILLTSKPMEQFRQRVIASCHLGPMDAQETRAYVEHRLHKVGWTDKPAIEAAAFEEIYRRTAGIPRRVNLLCSRLLLATFLGGGLTIDAAAVEAVANDIRSEIGGDGLEV